MDENVEPNQFKKILSFPNINYHLNPIKTSNYVVKKWSTFHRTIYRFMTPILKNVMPTFFNFESFGLENISSFPEGTPIIFAGNHRSHLDSLAGFSAISPPSGNRRYLTTISQGSVLKENKLFKLMGYIGAHPIDKKDPGASINYLYETLKAGLAVGIFPQGRRIARTPIEEYQNLSEEGRSGIGRLVLRMNGKVPVIPVYIHGTAEALSRGSVIPKFGSYISLTLGKPIYFSEYTDNTWDIQSKEFHQTSRVITNTIMKDIQELCLKTEQKLFHVIEQKTGKKISEISLNEQQSRQLRNWLRHISYIAPYDLPVE